MKKLEITKTKIGEKIGSYKGRYTIFSVYYGNYLSPMIENEFVHLKEEEYQALLEGFLCSEEGQDYERPSAAEIRSAEAAVLNSEIMYLKEKGDASVTLNLLTPESPAAPEKDCPEKKQRILTCLLLCGILLQTGAGILFLLA